MIQHAFCGPNRKRHDFETDPFLTGKPTGKPGSGVVNARRGGSARHLAMTFRPKRIQPSWTGCFVKRGGSLFVARLVEHSFALPPLFSKSACSRNPVLSPNGGTPQQNSWDSPVFPGKCHGPRRATQQIPRASWGGTDSKHSLKVNAWPFRKVAYCLQLPFMVPARQNCASRHPSRTFADSQIRKHELSLS